MLYALRVCCPVHNLPYESIVFTNNSSQFLRCSECPQDKNSLKLATQVQTFKSKIEAQIKKQKQNGKSRSRSKSKSKIQANTSMNKIKYTQQDEEQQFLYDKIIGNEQVEILQKLMLLLAQDQKKHNDNINKLGTTLNMFMKPYNQTNEDQKFLQNIKQKKIVMPYIFSLNQQGWKKFRKTFISIFSRTYLSKRMIKQCGSTINFIRTQGKISQSSILCNLENSVRKLGIKISGMQKVNNRKQQKKQNQSDLKTLRKNKRSKSFANK